MRIWEIALLPLLAVPMALANEMQAGRAVARHHEVEHMKRQGGVLGGIFGTGDDEASSSTPASLSRSVTLSPSAGSTTAPPSSAVSTTAPPTSSGTGTGSSSGLPSGSASISGSLSANISASASASNSSSIPIPSTSAAQSMSTSVDAQGQTVITTQFYTPSASSTSSSSAAATSAPPADSGPAISTGAIIGISVAAGVLVLSLIGCAIWRMKRRSGGEDEAIRWPELNRHGDSDAHHALPARQTGQHGIETSPLERSLSNSSSIYHSSLARGPSTHMASTAMALNGSNFGAANSLDYYDEKAYPSAGGYDAYDNYAPHGTVQDDAYGGAAMVEDYSSMPPPMQHAHSGHGGRTPGYGSDEDEMVAGAAGVGARHGAYGH